MSCLGVVGFIASTVLIQQLKLSKDEGKEMSATTTKEPEVTELDKMV